MLERQALGQAASLGTLYDARSDIFIPLSLFKAAPPVDGDAVTTTRVPSSSVRNSDKDGLNYKFYELGINPNLGASYLAGFLNVNGSGCYLDAKRDTHLAAHASLTYNLTTVNEAINFEASQLKDTFELRVLQLGLATHIVTEITWGARSIVTVQQSRPREDQENDDVIREIEGHVKGQISRLGAAILSGRDVDNPIDTRDESDSCGIAIYSDLDAAANGCVPVSLATASSFLRDVPKHVADTNDGKGKPVAYKLLPISEVYALLECGITSHLTTSHLTTNTNKPLNPDHAWKISRVFDVLADAYRQLRDYQSTWPEFRDYVSQLDIQTVDDDIERIRAAEKSLQSSVARALIDVRTGKTDEASLWATCDGFFEKEEAHWSSKSSSMEQLDEKIRVIRELVSTGAKYIGFNGLSLDLALRRIAKDVDVYVLYFCDEARRNNTVIWQQNLDLIRYVLNNHDDPARPPARVILKDCEYVDKARVVLFRNAERIIDDVWADRPESLNKFSAQY
ncbi:hypothetical protein B0T26DRAFT_871839 [Lasiosphaeria miniovina]|uniref:Uncharacterized protein n=1 Tax=Lasiosphaeria miniovina TaxID=1954250 RepID=A0AA40AK98_9PEZI|nr:uncharacterized protein B0T26DRAFT_871839 [Lasiosphaeria miniovina]KAK0717327.1 hypothetical protein B0T26DRAFT_871839 [Lasiosphaeria miniovina]